MYILIFVQQPRNEVTVTQVSLVLGITALMPIPITFLGDRGTQVCITCTRLLHGAAWLE